MRRIFVAFLAVSFLAAGCSAGSEAASSAAPTGSTAHAAPPSAGASAEAEPTAAATAAATDPATEPTAVAFDDPLLALELTDVRDGSRFTLGELAADGPVIVETMAIWCTNCRSQMREVTAAHELADFHSVSIDVEPTEIAEDLAAYSEREGFDWPFVLADATLASELRDRFGNEVLFPPGMPKLLVRGDGTVELLPIGQFLSADQIAELVGG